MGPRRPENGPAQDSTGVCTGTQPLCRPQPLDPNQPSHHLLATGAEHGMRNTGPRRRARERAGKEPGPGRPPRRRTRRPFGATLGRWSGRESASVPSAAKSEAATVPSAAVGETTAGVAVVAAVAAILARSMGPGRSRSGAKRIFQARRRGRWSRRPQRSRHRSMRRPITERGGERIQASRRGLSGRGGHGRGCIVRADHGGDV